MVVAGGGMVVGGGCSYVPLFGVKLEGGEIYKHALFHLPQSIHFAGLCLLDVEVCVTSTGSRSPELYGVGQHSISLLSALAHLCANTKEWRVCFLTLGNL